MGIVFPDLPSARQGIPIGVGVVWRWGMGPFQLNAALLDVGWISRPFQSIKIRPAVDKSLPNIIIASIESE